VPAEQTLGFGILKANRQGRITHFEEKPAADRLPHLASDIDGLGPQYLASMGIYVFGREMLEQSLREPALVDFGRHIIPGAVPSLRVHAFTYRGYWEDVGTIRSYYQANLNLCQPVPPFDFYDAAHPVYTHPRFLPASKVEYCTLRNVLISEGCIVVGAEIERSMVGIRAHIGDGARVTESLVLGADYYETVAELAAAAARNVPPIGIGAGTVVKGAIVDKNARIGAGVRILNEAGDTHRDGDGYFIREGVVIVPKDGVVRDGTVI
jgi:glucose-1-phosphate adenylyltransferase